MGLATLRRDWLLKHVIEPKITGRTEVMGNVNSHWMTLRKREDTGH